MVKRKPKKKTAVKKEKVCEIFKTGKGRTKRVCSEVSEKRATKKQLKEQTKILRNMFIIMGIFVLFVIGIILFLNSVQHVNYEGVKFDVVQEGNLILYKTFLPVIYQGKEAQYNFYLRNNPKKLKVEFDGDINFKKNVVMNLSDEFDCDGDEVIAIANVLQVYEVLGAEIIKDENATCDAEGRYMFIDLQFGNESKIEQTGPSCYEFYINNCEILEVTEKFLANTFAKVKKLQEQKEIYPIRVSEIGY